MTLHDLLTNIELEYVNHAIEQSETLLPIAPPWLQDKIGAMRDKTGKPLSINRNPYIIMPPQGKRTLDDVARLIQACIVRIQHAESECPTPHGYQQALAAEHKAYQAYQEVKYSADTYVRVKAKKAYEEAQEHRIQVGGMIHGTMSTVRRMNAMIAGEVIVLQEGRKAA